ncbi:PhzF family phenazine biosynthesis protein [Mangrovibacter phragmitis]|uniref:PhzF family phenazine biosynthesis protein n=1 Tax=Mangrovibacter phragmitis TaxID=1691903 RepID=UPI003369C848
MELAMYLVDAFAHQAFSGNPAGVCITPEPLPDALLQKIAAEMAVSETAFYAPGNQQLRWFTPLTEVNLCGHGTLATAHVLQQTGALNLGDTLTFSTLSGPLHVTAGRDAITMDFPLLPPNMAVPAGQSYLAALGLTDEQVTAQGMFGEKHFIVVSSEAVVRQLAPDFAALRALPGRGIVVSARGENGFDMVSRYFAPWVGVNEDPVTGSAHCALAAYWCAELGKAQLRAFQASARGGELSLALGEPGRVNIGGQARTVLVGQFIV